MSHNYDIVISGGGIAGLIAAAAFGAEGFSVLCVDPAKPVTQRDEDGSDLRTTAFLQPARQLLQDAQLWDRLEGQAAPLEIMRIVDAGTDVPQARITKDFKSSDISDLPFGWNLPNWFLKRELIAHLDDQGNVDLQLGTAVEGVMTRSAEAQVQLSNGNKIRCRLLIAADGRNSKVREAVGIDAKVIRYGQKALALAVTHPIPHENVSTEVHWSGGPFTLVPMPDYNGLPCSALVWMERSAKAQELFNLPEADFEAAMTERSANLFGPLKLASRRTIWPIISQLADRFSGERVALIAEAAHVVPPIGAQGLNTSLADLKVLLDLAKDQPDTLGSTAMLAKYERARKTEVKIRVAGIDLLNRASMAQEPVLRDMRAMGLNALYSMAPVRKMLMQMGLGLR